MISPIKKVARCCEFSKPIIASQKKRNLKMKTTYKDALKAQKLIEDKLLQNPNISSVGIAEETDLLGKKTGNYALKVGIVSLESYQNTIDHYLQIPREHVIKTKEGTKNIRIQLERTGLITSSLSEKNNKFLIKQSSDHHSIKTPSPINFNQSIQHFFNKQIPAPRRPHTNNTRPNFFKKETKPPLKPLFAFTAHYNLTNKTFSLIPPGYTGHFLSKKNPLLHIGKYSHLIEPLIRNYNSPLKYKITYTHPHQQQKKITTESKIPRKNNFSPNLFKLKAPNHSTYRRLDTHKQPHRKLR